MRTSVARTCSSYPFGPMLAVDSLSRNLTCRPAGLREGRPGLDLGAAKKISRPSDSLQVLRHVFAAAEAAATGIEKCGERFPAWAKAC